MIYLDYTANTPVEPQALEVFCEAERRFNGNANARHVAGREAAVPRNRKAALESWRVSLNRRTTMEELDEFIRIFDEVREKLTK